MMQNKLRVVGTSSLLIGLFLLAFAALPVTATAISYNLEAQLATMNRTIEDSKNDSDESNNSDESEEKPESNQRDENRSSTAAQRAKDSNSESRGRVLALSAAKQRVCSNHKSTIENKVTAMEAAVEGHFNRVRDVFQRVESFQKDHQIEVDQMQYDLAVQGVDDAEAVARVKIDLLKQQMLDSVDCTSDQTLQTLKIVKVSAQDAREALHDYGVSVRLYVAVLQDAYVQEKTSKSAAKQGFES